MRTRHPAARIDASTAPRGSSGPISPTALAPAARREPIGLRLRSPLRAPALPLCASCGRWASPRARSAPGWQRAGCTRPCRRLRARASRGGRARPVRLPAALACGPAALLSHRSAAALWGIRASASDADRRHVANPRWALPVRDRRPSCRSRRSAERPILDGIPCTTVARTVLDLARCLMPVGVGVPIHRAQVKRLLDRDRPRGRPGALVGMRGRRYGAADSPRRRP